MPEISPHVAGTALGLAGFAVEFASQLETFPVFMEWLEKTYPSAKSANGISRKTLEKLDHILTYNSALLLEEAKGGSNGSKTGGFRLR